MSTGHSLNCRLEGKKHKKIPGSGSDERNPLTAILQSIYQLLQQQVHWLLVEGLHSKIICISISRLIQQCDWPTGSVGVSLNC